MINTFKRIGQAVLHLLKQAWSLPATIPLAIRHRQERIVLDELEAERLDRIRNPSKYIGR